MICDTCGKAYKRQVWYEKHIILCRAGWRNEQMAILKKRGHEYEREFMTQFCRASVVSYGATTDCIISDTNLMASLASQWSVSSFGCSLKSGKISNSCWVGYPNSREKINRGEIQNICSKPISRRNILAYPLTYWFTARKKLGEYLVW